MFFCWFVVLVYVYALFFLILFLHWTFYGFFALDLLVSILFPVPIKIKDTFHLPCPVCTWGPKNLNTMKSFLALIKTFRVSSHFLGHKTHDVPEGKMRLKSVKLSAGYTSDLSPMLGNVCVGRLVVTN